MINIRTLGIITTAALLAGCAGMTPPASPANAGPAAYMAVGTEPFWNLEVTADELNFNQLGTPRIAVRNPGWRETAAGRSITSARIRVTVTPGPCSDNMSDQRYADHVRVIVDGRALSGCGGGTLAAPTASLERSAWRITAVAGNPAVAGVEADLNFADGRVTGTAGCNRLTGPFTQQRNQLSFGALSATRMACPGPRGEQEMRVFALMRQPLTISFGERMTMTWTAPDGTAISLRRLDWD